MIVAVVADKNLSQNIILFRVNYQYVNIDIDALKKLRWVEWCIHFKQFLKF